MTYDKACELLGFTTPKSLGENAHLAKLSQGRFTSACPLKYKVAASILVDAGNTVQYSDLSEHII
jgi:hypothetical protein